MELTQEQLQAAETMPMAELLALAAKEEVAKPVVAKDADEIDNSADAVEEEKEEETPATTIFRREIPNGNGSVDVYQADTLEELVEKIAIGKENANKQLQTIIAERKLEKAAQEKVSEDDNYVIAEKLKINPKQTMKEMVAEVIQEEKAQVARDLEIQSRFVASHSEYIANPENGRRLIAQLRLNGGTQLTVDGLEKAYQDLKADGLLVSKAEGAEVAAEEAPKDKPQTEESSASATQQRSPKRGSTISARAGVRVTTPVKTQPTLDEAYAMPLDQLRKLANEALASGS